MLTQEVKRFIRENADKTPEALALLARKLPDLPMAFIARQVKGRAKIKRKLPSWHEREDIVFPESISLEQCTSERVARWRAEVLGSCGVVVDLTGGFGVDARFMAERAARLHYFERNAELSEVVSENFRTFGLDEHVSVAAGDGMGLLRDVEGPVDLIFVDPARRDHRSLKVSALESCEPNLLQHWDLLLNRAGRVAAKLSPGLDVSSVLEDLPQIESLYVVSVENECKELFLVASKASHGEACIHCVDMLKDGSENELEFRLSEERELGANCEQPGGFLCEPNASIMKAGAFKTLSQRSGLKALNPRTRLYGSDRLREDFPGRVFEIVGEASIGAKEAKRLFPGGKANVISRNSGMDTVELRKKLKLREGGELFAIGAAVSGAGRRLFACKLVKS